MKLLHITNGDVAADLIRDSIYSDEVIVWKDVLFEGPVPGGLDDTGLAEVRAQYLDEMGYGNYNDIIKEFEKNDKLLSNYKEYDEVVLWFEHDLYDQLQLIQILNWFANQSHPINLKLISINEFEGIDLFLGFGQLTVEDLEQLFSTRVPVQGNMLMLGMHAWEAFTSHDPIRLVQLIKKDLSALPFLKDAFIRYLQEFPAIETGLTKTEFFILSSILKNEKNLGRIFGHLPVFEGKYFMGLGDTSFWNIVKRMAHYKAPLITLNGLNQEKDTPQSLNLDKIDAELTSIGLDILHGQNDVITLNSIDRWQGGVHLTIDNCWRWDDAKKSLLLNPDDI